MAETLALPRRRSLAALAGPQHPLMLALADAIADPEAIPDAVAQIDALEAIPRRRLLAALAVVL